MKKKNKIILASITLGLMGGGFLTGVIVPHLNKSNNVNNNVNVENNHNVDVNNQNDSILGIEINVLIGEIQEKINKLKVYQNYYQNKLDYLKRTRNKNDLISLKDEVNQWFQDHNGVELHIVMDNLNKDTTYDIFNEVKLLNDDLKEKDNVEVIFNVILDKIIAKEKIVKKLEPFKDTIVKKYNRYVRVKNDPNEKEFINEYNNLISSNVEVITKEIKKENDQDSSINTQPSNESTNNDQDSSINTQPSNESTNNDQDSTTNMESNNETSTTSNSQRFEQLKQWHNQLIDFKNWAEKEEEGREYNGTPTMFRLTFEDYYQKFENNKQSWTWWLYPDQKPSSVSYIDEENAKTTFEDVFENYKWFFTPLSEVINDRIDQKLFNYFDLNQNLVENHKYIYLWMKQIAIDKGYVFGSELVWYTTMMNNLKQPLLLDHFWQTHNKIENIISQFIKINKNVLNIKLQEKINDEIYLDSPQEIRSLNVYYENLKFNTLAFSNPRTERLYYPYYFDEDKWHKTPKRNNDFTFSSFWFFKKLITVFQSELTNENDDNMISFINKYYDKIKQDIDTNPSKYSKNTYNREIHNILNDEEDRIFDTESLLILPNLTSLIQKWTLRINPLHIADNMISNIEFLIESMRNNPNKNKILELLKPFVEKVHTFWNDKLDENINNSLSNYIVELNSQWQDVFKNLNTLELDVQNSFVEDFKNRLQKQNIFNVDYKIKKEFILNDTNSLNIINNWFNLIWFKNYSFSFDDEYFFNIKSVADDYLYKLTKLNTNKFFLKEWLISKDFIKSGLPQQTISLFVWLFGKPNEYEGRNVFYEKNKLKIYFNYNLYQYIDKNKYYYFKKEYQKPYVSILEILPENLVEKIILEMSNINSFEDNNKYNELLQEINIALDNIYKNSFKKLLEHETTQGKFFEKYNKYSDEQKQEDSFYVKITTSLNNWDSLSLEQIKELFIEFNNYTF